MKKPVVKFTNVFKTYSMFKKKSDKLLEILSLKKSGKSFSALSNVSFEVFEGETIGIIGINGSGKSTLSNLLAQVTPQTSGDIYINGETSLVAISVGLNNQLSGLENIELKCLMHGLTKEQIKKITPDIIEFADIGDFIKQPLKSYSSGMRSRLGFAISAHIQPDILIVDEALSVGDSTFYKKCLNKFDEFKKQGKTIFFISHSLSQVRNISDRILWLNFGKVKMFGDKVEVAKKYSNFIKWFNELSKQDQRKYRQKMLSNQMNVKDSVYQDLKVSRSRRHPKKKTKKKISFVLQIGILFFLFLYSILLMFVDYPVKAIKDNFETPIKGNTQKIEENDSANEPIVEVNESGYITEKKAIIYKDADLEEKITEVPFASKVNIIEEINGLAYKVNFEENVGFIQPEIVDIMDDKEIKKSSITIEDLLPMFPRQFKESYSFFLTFLNTGYDELKGNLHGLTDEYMDDFGRTILEYDNVSYIFNKSNNSVAIQLNDVMMSETVLTEAIAKSALASNDGNLYYLSTKAYGIYIDIENDSITFKLN